MPGLAFTVVAVILATWSGWALWRSPLLRTVETHSSQPKRFIERQAHYQAVFLMLALVVAAFAIAVSSQDSKQLFSVGTLSSPVQAKAFGFAHATGVTWLQLGILLTLTFALTTYALVSSSLRCILDWTAFLRKFGGWIVVLSATNALSEELIYRGAVLAAADGQLQPLQAALLSAVLFAIAHIRGQASGLAVIAGSAVVGWCLAHAVMQTHGLFWAWCIHFTQDMVIFAAFIAESANPPFQGTLRNEAVGKT